VKGEVQMELFANDRNQDIDADGDPDLGLHRVKRVAEEAAYAEVLLDPFEEELDLPTVLVEPSNIGCIGCDEVGEEGQFYAAFWVDKANLPQQIGEEASWPEVARMTEMVGAYARIGLGKRPRSGEIERLESAHHKESTVLMKAVETGESFVRTVHNIDGVWFGCDAVEKIDVVNALGCNVDKCGDGSPQIELCMDLDSRHAFLETSPWEEPEAYRDGCAVQCVCCIGQVQFQLLASVELASLGDQLLPQVRIDPKIARLVGVGQCAAGNPISKSHVIAKLGTSIQTTFDVSETVPESHLSKTHAQELFSAGEATHAMVASMEHDTPTELLPVDAFHHLREDRAYRIHDTCHERAQSPTQATNASHYSSSSSCLTSTHYN